MSTLRKFSFDYLNSSMQKSRNLGRSLASVLIVSGEEANVTSYSGEPKSDADQFAWLNADDKAEIELKILMPNGLLFMLKTHRRATLKQIKEEVFELAEKQPLYGVLHNKSNYLFSCVNRETAVQEMLDDNYLLNEIRPFFQTMRLIKKQDDKKEKQLNAQISILIGKGLHEFDALKNAEINNYRWLALKFTESFANMRKNCSKLDYIHQNYPVRLERTPEIPSYLKKKLSASDNKIMIEFRLNSSKMFHILKISCFEKMEKVINTCLKVVGKEKLNVNRDYVIKVSGQEEYLGILDDYPLIQYTFIRESLSNSKMPSFVIKSIEEIKLFNVNPTELNPHNLKAEKCFREPTMSSFQNAPNRRTPVCILDLHPDIKLQIELKNAIRVNCADNTLVAVVIGLYHGTKLLCAKRSSNSYPVQNGQMCIDQLLEFDISVVDLPRMCRYSIMLFEILVPTTKKNSNPMLLIANQNASNNDNSMNIASLNRYLTSNNEVYSLPINHSIMRRETKLINNGIPLKSLAISNHALLTNPLCWINLNLFDYNSQLRTDATTLAMWNYTELHNSRVHQNNSIALDDLLADLNSFDEIQWYEMEEETLLNPLGIVTANPNTGNATCLTCTLTNYTQDVNSYLYYPSTERIIEHYKSIHQTENEDELQEALNARQQSNDDLNTSMNFDVQELKNLVQSKIITENYLLPISNKNPTNNNDKTHPASLSDLDDGWSTVKSQRTKGNFQLLSNSITNSSNSLVKLGPTITKKVRKASKAYLDQLKEICQKDPLNDLDRTDKELIWFLKEFLKDCLPNSLTHLLASVKWNTFEGHVLDLLVLINDWPLLSPEKALELLDFEYSDLSVRRFAVNCLQVLTDEELDLYLLQLVQALKFESYMHNDLSEFLLHRALQNPNIGHRFFWLLRSEMNDPSVSIKFGLLLEAYCRGATNHLKSLFKQLDTLNKFKEINEFIRQEALKRKENRYKLKQTMQNILHQSYYRGAFQNIISPLNPRQRLDAIKIEKCKFMDSKMKPLWMVFSNEDLGVEDTSIIFKNGDDLRQDMLTIQMLRLFDKLWKDQGLDLRLTCYNVITTHYKVGLIEVVPMANTVANIQKKYAFSSATSTFQKSSLLQWLRENNPDEENLLAAIDEFTKSCAGYCVATYVLGIADRHSDNIMLKSNGQLLHIDFGHILGDFKLKWKIRRERCPFVFTNDFAYVITNGCSKKDSERFRKFLSYCDQAFLVLRRKGTFIIALFAMMLSTGLELSTTKDLAYLRETLVLDLNEQDALKNFRQKFDESLKNSWKTSFNWFAHNIAKDNN